MLPVHSETTARKQPPLLPPPPSPTKTFNRIHKGTSKYDVPGIIITAAIAVLLKVFWPWYCGDNSITFLRVLFSACGVPAWAEANHPFEPIMYAQTLITYLCRVVWEVLNHTRYPKTRRYKREVYVEVLVCAEELVLAVHTGYTLSIYPAVI